MGCKCRNTDLATDLEKVQKCTVHGACCLIEIHLCFLFISIISYQFFVFFCLIYCVVKRISFFNSPVSIFILGNCSTPRIKQCSFKSCNIRKSWPFYRKLCFHIQFICCSWTSFRTRITKTLIILCFSKKIY